MRLFLLFRLWLLVVVCMVLVMCVGCKATCDGWWYMIGGMGVPKENNVWIDLAQERFESISWYIAKSPPGTPALAA